MANAPFKKTDQPDDEIGSPGMGARLGVLMGRDYCVWHGMEYTLGHKLLIGEVGRRIEIVATKHGWQKTGNGDYTTVRGGL